MLTDDGRRTTNDERRTTNDDGRKPIAIGHLSDSGDLKNQFFDFFSSLQDQEIKKNQFYDFFFPVCKTKNRTLNIHNFPHSMLYRRTNFRGHSENEMSIEVQRHAKISSMITIGATSHL